MNRVLAMGFLTTKPAREQGKKAGERNLIQSSRHNDTKEQHAQTFGRHIDCGDYSEKGAKLLKR